MQIDLRKLAQLLCEIFEIEDITQASTPSGRWALLQAWLKNHPRWKIRIARWARLDPEHAYAELREWVSEEGGISIGMLKAFISAQVEARIKGAIITLQTLYTERAREAPQLQRRNV